MFDTAQEKALADWIAELRSEMPAILAWWEATRDRLEAQAPGMSSIHWPAGPVGHPRIVAIYRKHYFIVRALNLDIDALDDEMDRPARAEEDALWGIDDEDEKEDDAPAPVSPNVLLLAALADYDPEVAEFMLKFDFRPIGETPEFEVC